MNNQEIKALATQFVNAMDKVIEENKEKCHDILHEYSISEDQIKRALLEKYLIDKNIVYRIVLIFGTIYKDNKPLTRVWIEVEDGTTIDVNYNRQDVIHVNKDQKELSGALIPTPFKLTGKRENEYDYSRLSKIICSPFLTMEELYNMIILYIE